MYSAAALPRPLALLAAPVLACAIPLSLTSGCAGRRPAAKPAPFPPAPTWKTLIGDSVTPPLAAANRRIYVTARDDSVRALDEATGAVQWQAASLPGLVSAAGGAVVVRSREGRVTCLQPRTGAPRWTVEVGLPGTLPAVIDGDRVLIAGHGLAALDLASGRLLWSDKTGAEVTAPPVRVGARLLTGEADGTLRSRDRATGLSIWSVRTARTLLAPPLVDPARAAVYLGTTDKRILAADLNTGHLRWHWTVGADIVDPGFLTGGKVLFACYDAVLYALQRGGNLAWRAPLPSRPLSGPLPLDGYVIVACLENELVAFDPATGKRAASMRTAAEIRTPPLLTGAYLVIGLRDRSVVAYALPGTDASVPAAPPAPASAPELEPGGSGR